MKKFFSKFKHIIYLHIILAVYSFLGISSKLAAGEEFLSIRFLFWYGIVIFNLFLYAVVWQQILKKINLVTAYSNKAVTIIWGLIWGYILFDEKISFCKIISVFVIIAGVSLVVLSEGDDLN